MPGSGLAAGGSAWKGALLGVHCTWRALTNWFLAPMRVHCRADQACSGQAVRIEGLPARLSCIELLRLIGTCACFRSS